VSEVTKAMGRHRPEEKKSIKRCFDARCNNSQPKGRGGAQKYQLSHARGGVKFTAPWEPAYRPQGDVGQDDEQSCVGAWGKCMLATACQPQYTNSKGKVNERGKTHVAAGGEKKKKERYAIGGGGKRHEKGGREKQEQRGAGQ